MGSIKLICYDFCLKLLLESFILSLETFLINFFFVRFLNLHESVVILLHNGLERQLKKFWHMNIHFLTILVLFIAQLVHKMLFIVFVVLYYEGGLLTLWYMFLVRVAFA